MSQANQPVQAQAPAAVTCPLCQTWVAQLPYAQRHSTPLMPNEAFGVMVIGFWLAARGARDEHLCPQHNAMLVNLDVQKHMQEEQIRTEEAQRAAEATKPKYPSPEHEGIAQRLIGKIQQVNAPASMVPQGPPSAPMLTRVQVPAPVPPAPDPNKFPCPDCKKPISSGEVHTCATPEPQ
jgi:hypothetical protein